MIYNQLMHDCFGRRYKLHRLGDGLAPKQIKPKVFHDVVSTRTFLNNMRVSKVYWRQLSYELVGRLPYTANPFDYLDAIVHLLIQGRVQLFEIGMMDMKHHPIGKSTFKQPDGKVYQFVPPAEQFISPNKKAKKFASKKEAVEFVEKMALEEDGLSDVARAFNLHTPVSNSPNDKQKTLAASIGDAVMEEKILILEAAPVAPNKPKAAELVYEDVYIKPISLGPETKETKIKVKAKIDAEYTVVLFDKQLSQYQDPSEEKIQVAATAVELWLEQDSFSPIFDQGAKVDLSGAGKIQAFLDKELTTELNLSELIPADKITGGNKLKVWVIGKTAGKFNVKLTPSKSANGKFIIQTPAKLEMGVVELKLEVYEQDLPGIAKIKVDPDQEPISDYHTELEAINFPDQVLLTDENKVKNGRLLHAQKDANSGRSKIVIKALTADEFPAGSDSYQITVSSGGKSGSLKLFDAEFDGNEIPLPLNIDKKSLTADKTYWVEGVGESNALRETCLDLGLSLAGRTPIRNGDWACFTVVKLFEVSLKVVTHADKAEVWDMAKKRFYTNLDDTEEARKLKDKPGQRDVEVKASLSQKIPGVTVHFILVPDKRNWDKNHWGAKITGFDFSKVERALKQVDKKDHKDLIHLAAKTNADGDAIINSLELSRIGGDIFHLGAYVDQDAHLAKYVDGHAVLSNRKPVFFKDSIEIWRKFYVQNTFNKNIALPSRALTGTSFEKCFIEINEVDEEQYDPANIAGLVEHELWQFDMSGSVRKVVCVGDVNKAKFTNLFKAPTDVTKPKAHMVMCDVQWDSEIGSPQDFPVSQLASSINYKNSAGNKYLGVFDPPLGGGPIVLPSSKWTWNDGAKMHQGILDDTNAAIEKSRGHYSEVKITIPAVCPASCPCGNPGTAIAPTAIKQAIVRVRLKAATGPWAGESGRPGNPQCLIVVNNNLNQFNNTIAHEIGHLFKSVRKDTAWKGIPDHPDQYVERGGQGSHCKEGAVEHATAVDQSGKKQYVGGTCVMYHVAVGNTVFCDNCSADIRVRDVSDTFKD